jgi:tRNA(fMet)-specific endonuclease VapC
MIYLLDTNHCTHLLRSKPAVQQRRQSLLNQPGQVQIATSVTVRGELMFMVERSEQRERNLHLVEELLSHLVVYPVDTETADWYGVLKSLVIDRFGTKDKARRRKTKVESLGIAENDLWIAATAKRHNAIVVSSDRDFERICQVTQLTVEVWTDTGA